MLRELNYSVRHAANGQDALAMIREGGDFALLFTDVVMPGMLGALWLKMRGLLPDLKVIYTTGYTANAVVHNGVVDHVSIYCRSPFATTSSLEKFARYSTDLKHEFSAEPLNLFARLTVTFKSFTKPFETSRPIHER